MLRAPLVDADLISQISPRPLPLQLGTAFIDPKAWRVTQSRDGVDTPTSGIFEGDAIAGTASRAVSNALRSWVERSSLSMNTAVSVFWLQLQETAGSKSKRPQLAKCFCEVREFLKQQGVTWDLCFLSARAFNCVCLRVGPRAGFLKSPGTAHRSLTAARAGGVPVRRGSDGADTFVKGTARLSYERVYSSTYVQYRYSTVRTCPYDKRWLAHGWVGGRALGRSMVGRKEGTKELTNTRTLRICGVDGRGPAHRHVWMEVRSSRRSAGGARATRER